MEKNERDLRSTDIVNKELLSKIIAYFPDATPDFLRRICHNKPCTQYVIDKIITRLELMPFYPRREEYVNNSFDTSNNVKIRSNGHCHDDIIALATSKMDEFEYSNDIIVQNVQLETEINDTNQLYQQMFEMFEDIEPTFLRALCQHKLNTSKVREELITKIFSMPEYPKSGNKRLEILTAVLPSADTQFLIQELERIHSDEDLNLFISKMLQISENQDIDNLQNQCITECLDSGEDEAIALQNPIIEDVNVWQHVSSIFKDADPIYLINLCDNIPNTQQALDELVAKIYAIGDYPKSKLTPYDILLHVLPDADPEFLKNELQKFTTDGEIDVFISNALETLDYPRIKKPKIKLSQIRLYTTDFNVAKFAKLIPDPAEYFNKSECIKDLTIKLDDNLSDIRLQFLENEFLSFSTEHIKNTFIAREYNIIRSCEYLETDEIVNLSVKRKPINISYEEAINIPILQAIAYLTHKDEINQFIEEQKILDVIERDQCRSDGLMLTCNCCFDAEIIPKDIVECSGGCIFCKFCLEKSVEVAFGEGKLDYPCMKNCGHHFTSKTLKDTLNQKLFSKIAQKRQLKEVKAAGIDELESCPFCEFATIPAPGDKLFMCLNPECKTESCRECKEVSHVPFRCHELEKDSEVKNRVYIENKMSEALLRECRCGMKIIKEDGCNKMTCSCGATLCYVCKKPNVDYTHFNGQGGEKFRLCPLWCDINLLHQGEVLTSAEAAIAEVGLESLKIDPTADIKSYYENLRR